MSPNVWHKHQELDDMEKAFCALLEEGFDPPRLLLLCQSFADVLSSMSKAQQAANSVEFFDLL